MVDNSGGIYCVRNLLNDKRYVGSTVNFRSRKSRHFSDLRKGVHKNPHLQSSFNKHNEDDYLFEILEYVEDPRNNKQFLLDREDYWKDFYECNDPEFGYNIRKKASSNLGLKNSKEAIEKTANAHRGKPLSEETKRKIGDAQRGEKSFYYGKTGKETPNFGNKHTEETKKKISDSLKGRPSINKGRILTEETKRKISVANTGRVVSEDQIKKMSKNMMGKYAGEKNPAVKLSISDIFLIRKMLLMDIPGVDIANFFNVSNSTISNIKTKRNWKTI